MDTINTEQESMIIIDNLTKNYPNKQVINDLSLTVYKGELFGFIGRNGAGKSTTIECMIGVRPFEKGTITIDGFDIKKGLQRAAPPRPWQQRACLMQR